MKKIILLISIIYIYNQDITTLQNFTLDGGQIYDVYFDTSDYSILKKNSIIKMDYGS